MGEVGRHSSRPSSCSNEVSQDRLLRAMSSLWVLSITKGRDPTSSLGNPILEFELIVLHLQCFMISLKKILNFQLKWLATEYDKKTIVLSAVCHTEHFSSLLWKVFLISIDSFWGLLSYYISVNESTCFLIYICMIEGVIYSREEDIHLWR